MNMMITSATVRTLLGVALALALAGCASTSAPPDAAATHPANPNATASPVPPLQPGLLALTNIVMVNPGTESAPEHQHDHEKQEAKPRPEEKK
jgi:PBP1b-binding outer membrane lipoprotein LpoB